MIEKTDTFIIAEVGVNHNGNIGIAKELIDVASESGANAVKFQIVNSDDSYSKDNISYQMFKKAELKKNEYRTLFNRFKKRGIVFATPGDLKSLKLCEELNL